MTVTAFSAAVPLLRTSPTNLACSKRCPLACATPPRSQARNFAHRAAATAAAAVVLGSVAPQLPVHALGLAPTPINPYARRRAEKAYVEYARKLEQKIEHMDVFPVADFRGVVSHSGGELKGGFRVAGFAAFVAATISTAIIHPLDSVKTRLQAGARGRSALFSGLYRGVFGNILKEAPNAAVYLAVYELIKGALLHSGATSFFRDLPLLTFLLAGALGDAVGSVVRVPAEVTNKRLQLGLSASLFDAFRDVFCSRAGRGALKSAWIATLWRDVPYGGLQIMLYESGKLALQANATALPAFIPSSGTAADVLVGALVAAIAAFVTTPADVLVTRVAMASGIEGPAPSVVAHLRTVVNENGPLGLFSGALQRSIIYMAMGGMFFSLYEIASNLASNPHTLEIALQHAQGALSGAVTLVGSSIEMLSTRPVSAVDLVVVEHLPYLLSMLLLQT